MKIFDFKNPRHIEILREELNRAKQIIKNTSNTNFKKTDSGKLVSREISEMQSDFNNTTVLDATLVANWMASNKKLLSNYTFTSGGNTQTVADIIAWLRKGRASQFYIQSLIDDMDKLEGVAIDDHEFYKPAAAKITSTPQSDANPYDMPGGQPSRSQMGGNWTGD